MKKIIIVSLLLSMAYFVAKSATSHYTKQNIEVWAQQPKVQSLYNSINATGYTYFEDEVLIGTEISGRVGTVFIKTGDNVKKGDKLLELEKDVLQNQIYAIEAKINGLIKQAERVQAELKELERKHNSYTRLRTKGLVENELILETKHQLVLKEIDLEIVLSNVEEQRMVLNQLTSSLNKSTIISPINGEVSMLKVKAGTSIVPGVLNMSGSSLAVISNTDTFAVKGYVNESDIDEIFVGQKVNLFFATNNEKLFVGEVRSKSFYAIKINNNPVYEVTINFDNTTSPNEKYSGLNVRIEFVTSSSEATTTVPRESVFKTTNKKKYVWVLDNGSAVQRFVETGNMDEVAIEILQGINDKDLVLTGPLEQLKQLKNFSKVTLLEYKK